jgi:hypothetical protein
MGEQESMCLVILGWFCGKRASFLHFKVLGELSQEKDTRIRIFKVRAKTQNVLEAGAAITL